MALTFKTPGVYLQEISKLPPSVAEVETAIPAFIGYTEKVPKDLAGNPDSSPRRITSLLEYETSFGGAANETEIKVNIATDGTIIVNGPTHANRRPFLMYYSLQMYFANGGGPCYITSVGNYTTVTPTAADLKVGLDKIKKQDEPTLIVFPDATFVNEPDFYTVYNDALKQCQSLQDRFVIMDTYSDAPSSIADFRDDISNNQDELKYGAVYYPSLQTTLKYKYLDTQVLVTDADEPGYAARVNTIKSTINPASLEVSIEDFDNALEAIRTYSGPEDLDDYATEQLEDVVLPLMTSITTYMSALQGKLTSIGSIVTEAIHENPTVNPDGLNLANADLSAWKQEFIIDAMTAFPALGALDEQATIVAAMTVISNKLHIGVGPNPPSLAATIGIDLVPLTGGKITAITDELANFVNAYLSSYELDNNVLYNQIKGEINKLSVILPPSSAIAGIYANTDANKGVWTAPANVSLNYTIAPTVFIDNAGQEDMNVTPTGKSVNAIRSFTGRGTLVWGARTLTGNSNEWRYVPVRRFFNFVEESVKKGTEAFVFQSNDANTWVKVKGMIENFLIQQWKNGALMGAKPEQAFYVSVGLGQTMTAQDVLEGRMIVEIGMAVVRPAEFIVLQFSHKMPEA